MGGHSLCYSRLTPGFVLGVIPDDTGVTMYGGEDRIGACHVQVKCLAIVLFSGA